MQQARKNTCIDSYTRSPSVCPRLANRGRIVILQHIYRRETDLISRRPYSVQHITILHLTSYSINVTCIGSFQVEQRHVLCIYRLFNGTVEDDGLSIEAIIAFSSNRAGADICFNRNGYGRRGGGPINSANAVRCIAISRQKLN